MQDNLDKRSQDQLLLRKSEERLRQIVRASPVAMIVARGPNETMELANDKFTELFGYAMEDIPDVHHWWPLAYPDPNYREQIKAAWQLRIEKALRNSSAVESMEARVRCKDGSTRNIEFHLAMLGDDFLVSFVDLTARKMAEEALRASEERFRLAAEAGRMYAYQWDLATNMVIRSAECKNVLGGAAPLCAPLAEISARINPEDFTQISAAVSSICPQNPTNRVAYRSRKMDGTEVWLEQSFRGSFDQNGNVSSLVGMVVDITSRKETENALKALGGRLIEAQEQERRRIARDLHDDINQRLAILNIELHRLADDLPDSRETLRQTVENLSARVSRISTEISTITHELHSSKLELLGIVAAMRGFCKEMNALQNMAVDFQTSGVPLDLPRDISLCLFRVFQEALRNAARHSGTQEVVTKLTAEANEIILKIRDRGAGFTPECALNSQGLGLASMRERVGLVKGSLSIISKPNEGTSIHVRIPFKP